jgi:putative ABC transport system ATP-binding protein
MENIALSISDSSKDRLLSKNINLKLASQELIPISGISGIGKTTLLRTICGLSPFQEGIIRIFGKPLFEHNISSMRTKCIYLHQHPVMFPGAVEFNILAPFRFRAVRQTAPDRSDLIESLERFGLNENILTSEAGSISGGEAQRVALIRALLLNPNILLLDEPTASLDTDSSKYIIEYLLNWVRDEDRGIIWVVHETDVIQKLGKRPLHLTRDGLSE